jgi:hypothetical protein
MKINQLKKYVGLGLTALLLGASSSLAPAQMPITNIIQTFDIDDPQDHWGKEWGPGTQAWDGVEGLPSGALLMTAVLSGSSDTPLTTYVTKLGNPWWVGTPLNFSTYDYLEFDIKYDNTSDITIAQFNNVGTIPADATNSLGQTILQSWAGVGYIGGINGLDITLCGGPAGQMAPTIILTNIPDAAASGWAHVKIPINKAQANIDGVSGIVFHKWVSQNWGIANDAQARFWVDNIMLTGTEAVPPPPIVSVPTKAVKGLNVFTSAGGLYDRQSAVLRQNTGLSWVGQASEVNPVTYAFTIAGYPNSVNCEAWMFLLPNPDYLHSAPDWNGTNCVKIRLQGTATSGTMQFQYKVNEDHQQAMYYGGDETRGFYTNAPGSWDGVTPNYLETGFLGQVAGNSILGKWQVRFTSDTNVTLIAPNGATTNFVMPAYNAGYFAEQTTPGFYIYLGLQANNADAMNQALVISDFAVSNSVSPYYENFLTDEVLDTTNVWNTSAAPAPSGVLLVSSNASSWARWTLPDPGFSLQVGTNLTSPLAWADIATGVRFPMNGLRAQLLSNEDLPASAATFFRLIKRNFTQLQVLLPGETNAPNTLTGKVGTPDPVSLSGSGGFVTVTINAVDDTWHIISSGAGTINLTSTDGSAIMPLDGNLANGTLQPVVQFGSEGTWTVTATNLSATMPAATSSSVVVGP